MGEVAERQAPPKPLSPAPIEVALWDADEVAGFLRIRRRHCAEKLVFEPDFPRPIVLPSTGGGKRGQKVWKAKEVIEWAGGRQQ